MGRVAGDINRDCSLPGMGWGDACACMCMHMWTYTHAQTQKHTNSYWIPYESAFFLRLRGKRGREFWHIYLPPSYTEDWNLCVLVPEPGVWWTSCGSWRRNPCSMELPLEFGWVYALRVSRSIVFQTWNFSGKAWQWKVCQSKVAKWSRDKILWRWSGAKMILVNIFCLFWEEAEEMAGQSWMFLATSAPDSSLSRSWKPVIRHSEFESI